VSPTLFTASPSLEPSPSRILQVVVSSVSFSPRCCFSQFNDRDFAKEPSPATVASSGDFENSCWPPGFFLLCFVNASPPSSSRLPGSLLPSRSSFREFMLFCCLLELLFLGSLFPAWSKQGSSLFVQLGVPFFQAPDLPVSADRSLAPRVLHSPHFKKFRSPPFFYFGQGFAQFPSRVNIPFLLT